ncbi:unnamed protein product [Citrullus colocynthis]|uniref:RRP4 S1 domain-containing protein n=1 Tax=Citrullus colocynthis TaxID=252529 RepID=A0ABP0ZEY5_9ROSI
MRALQISLNHTQKIRLQKAREMLESLSSKANSDASVIVADTMPLNYEYGVLKGHGTLDLNGEVVAAICGVIERVNKLIYIKLEVCDIVVEHVSEVASKRWRLDINYSQDAVLMLSSMSLPDGIQVLEKSLLEIMDDYGLEQWPKQDDYGLEKSVVHRLRHIRLINASLASCLVLARCQMPFSFVPCCSSPRSQNSRHSNVAAKYVVFSMMDYTFKQEARSMGR